MRALPGMQNNVVYERREIATGIFVWQGGEELQRRGGYVPVPLSQNHRNVNDNRRVFIVRHR